MKHKAQHQARAPQQPQQVLFPSSGLSQNELDDYYRQAGPWLLEYLRGRPLQARRWNPATAGDTEALALRPDDWPAALRRLEPSAADGSWAALEDSEGLAWLARQGCIELQAWLSRGPQFDHPDQMVFDLEPGERPFHEAKTAAALLADLLEDLGLKAFPLLSGDTGLQLRIPLDAAADFASTRALARRVARAVMMEEPERYTAESNPARRGERLFIDYLANVRGGLALVPGSLRARPGAPVAAPVSWDELGDPDLGPRSVRHGQLLERLRGDEQPWAGFGEGAYSVARAHDRLDRSANTV